MISVTNTFTKKIEDTCLRNQCQLVLIGCWGSRWCLSPSCLRSGGEGSGFEVFRGGVGLSAPRGKWHDDDDFDRSLPPRWTRVPRQRPRWVVRPKSVFSDGRDLVDRDVNCRPLDWKYDNFPVQEMALQGIWVDLTWRVTLQLQRLWGDQFARQTCCTFIPGNKPKQECSLLQAAIKDLI